jgi:predicted O-linked N-acetylglucosamine transferase (SPINDLY family)
MRNKFNQIPKPKPKAVANVNPALAQQIAAKLQQGLALHNTGQLEQAKTTYEEILKLNSNHYDSIQLLGAIATQTRQWTKALDLYARALTLNSQNAVVFYNQGIALEELKRLEEALASYNKAIELKQDYADAYLNRGNVLQELMRLNEALQSFEQCIEYKHDFAEAHYNRGNVLNKLKHLDESLLSYEQAIKYKNEYFEAYIGLGNALKKLKRLEESLVSYDKALELGCAYAEIYSNRGIVLRELNRLDEALQSYDTAIELNHDFVDAFYNRGNVLYELKRLDEALTSYDRAIELKPDYEYLFGTMLHTKMSLCDWQESEINVKELSLRITEGKKSSPSFPVLALIDSLSVQRKASEIWINDKNPFNSSFGLIPKRQRKNKIRIGYYSADFREHPVSYLIAELFELHGKRNFELIAFYSGPADSSNLHKRVASAFDRFIDIRLKGDGEVAQLSRDLGIDIAIDLTGITGNNRVGVFSYRVAPIQLSYIGYLGTMGSAYYDYLIADKTIIPMESQQYYKEKIVYLPSYQVNDSKREIADKIFTRADLNLPERGFVFCCFNNNYKITPSTFDGWMRILTAVPESVLFLYVDNKRAEANLKLEAEKRGINKTRLVFGARIGRSEYLARYRAADLFLDTLPYNAGTTASDALWAGLPVLTCMGESFASRVAASLLNAIELPELITTTQEQYETTAIELATNPTKLKDIKDKLERNRLTTALFDTPRFTKHIEAAYTQMYERYQADLPLDHIYIED